VVKPSHQAAGKKKTETAASSASLCQRRRNLAGGKGRTPSHHRSQGRKGKGKKAHLWGAQIKILEEMSTLLSTSGEGGEMSRSKGGEREGPYGPKGSRQGSRSSEEGGVRKYSHWGRGGTTGVVVQLTRRREGSRKRAEQNIRSARHEKHPLGAATLYYTGKLGIGGGRLFRVKRLPQRGFCNGEGGVGRESKKPREKIYTLPKGKKRPHGGRPGLWGATREKRRAVN